VAVVCYSLKGRGCGFSSFDSAATRWPQEIQLPEHCGPDVPIILAAIGEDLRGNNAAAEVRSKRRSKRADVPAESRIVPSSELQREEELQGLMGAVALVRLSNRTVPQIGIEQLRTHIVAAAVTHSNKARRRKAKRAQEHAAAARQKQRD
jgi:hypothetical protein